MVLRKFNGGADREYLPVSPHVSSFPAFPAPDALGGESRMFSASHSRLIFRSRTSHKTPGSLYMFPCSSSYASVFCSFWTLERKDCLITVYVPSATRCHIEHRVLFMFLYSTSYASAFSSIPTLDWKYWRLFNYCMFFLLLNITYNTVFDLSVFLFHFVCLFLFQLPNTSMQGMTSV